MSQESFFRNKRVRLAIPFFIFVIGGSIGLKEFTSLRYKYRPIESVNPRDAAAKLGLKVKKLEEVTLEAQYEELKKKDLSKWENKRIPRPASWGTTLSYILRNLILRNYDWIRQDTVWKHYKDCFYGLKIKKQNQLTMYPQNSLVSLMANYHDSDDDDEGADENIQKNLNIFNLTPSESNRLSPGSLNGILNTNNNNHDMSNVLAQNLSFEKSIELPNSSENHFVSQLEIDNDILLPPEPTGSCALALQDKITKLYQKIEAGQLDMNQWIQGHKDFRNPSIYEKLISFCNIDELGTNYPSDKFDPTQWPEDSYYDKLAVAQNEKMKKLMAKK